MAARILTLNAGSSSIKYALFDAAGSLQEPLRSGLIQGLGVGGRSHLRALQELLGQLGNEPVVAVGHRIVHGGTRFAAPVLIDQAVFDDIAALQSLAPLHQPHNLAGVSAARVAFAQAAQVAAFDTAFHHTMPEVNQRFALPQALHAAGMRRYGFHGLSYESICAQLRELSALEAPGRIVIAHLGNGASMCAVQGLKSVATTMSFSPLDGLPMGTRCGALDPAVVLHLLQRGGRSVDEVAQLLARESGLLGLSGVSADMRELQASAAPGAKLAIDYFIEQVLQHLGSLAAALRGLDGLVFTGGIGENAAALRARIVEGAAWLGCRLDAQANAAAAPGLISTPDSTVQVRVLRTQEEAVIARQTALAAGLCAPSA